MVGFQGCAAAKLLLVTQKVNRLVEAIEAHGVLRGDGSSDDFASTDYGSARSDQADGVHFAGRVEDDHVRAAVAMSPPGPGRYSFSDNSWDRVAVPTMTMSGTRDRGPAGEPPEWRTQPFKHMPAGNKYHVLVDGAEHTSFALGQRFHACILKESIAFWDKYLRGSSATLQSVDECKVTAK